VTDFISGR